MPVQPSQPRPALLLRLIKLAVQDSGCFRSLSANLVVVWRRRLGLGPPSARRLGTPPPVQP